MAPTVGYWNRVLRRTLFQGSHMVQKSASRQDENSLAVSRTIPPRLGWKRFRSDCFSGLESVSDDFYKGQTQVARRAKLVSLNARRFNQPHGLQRVDRQFFVGDELVAPTTGYHELFQFTGFAQDDQMAGREPVLGVYCGGIEPCGRFGPAATQVARRNVAGFQR